MSYKSKKFEQIIFQIYDLLKQNNSEVIWDGKVKDPDNPKQDRQIDILIKNEGFTTHVECRDRKSKQDVMWIEELQGRKQSLNADFLIAVSSSGFTSGAIKKAKRFEIELRDLRSLSKEDVLSWGKACSIDVAYLELKDLEFVLTFVSEDELSTLSKDEIPEFFRKHNLTYTVLTKFLNEFQERALIEDDIIYDIEWWGTVITKDLHLRGMKLVGVDSTVKFKKIYKNHHISEAFLFGLPKENSLDRTVNIQRFTYENWQLIDTPSKGSFIIDPSILNHPENCFFLGVKLKGLNNKKVYDIRVEKTNKILLFDAVGAKFTGILIKKAL